MLLTTKVVLGLRIQPNDAKHHRSTPGFPDLLHLLQAHQHPPDFRSAQPHIDACALGYPLA